MANEKDEDDSSIGTETYAPDSMIGHLAQLYLRYGKQVLTIRRSGRNFRFAVGREMKRIYESNADKNDVKFIPDTDQLYFPYPNDKQASVCILVDFSSPDGISQNPNLRFWLLGKINSVKINFVNSLVKNYKQKTGIALIKGNEREYYHPISFDPRADSVKVLAEKMVESLIIAHGVFKTCEHILAED